MCETVRTAQDRTPVLCEMCEMPIGIALRTAFRTARHGYSVSHSGAGTLQLVPLGAPATGLQPACRKVAATDGVQLRAQNRPETRMNPRVAMQPLPCNRPTVLQRLRCTLHPRGEATPATVAADAFMVSVSSGPENLERLGVHLLPFQVERPLERFPDFPYEITVPSQWNGRNGNIVPFQFFFYVDSLERRADMQAARCTASTMNAGFAAAPPMKPPPMPMAATRKPYKRFSGAGRGEVAKRRRAPVSRFLAASGRNLERP